MNATDILTEILRGGAGGGIFKDIFGGGGGGPAQPRRQPEVTTAPPAEIEREARELEDMLGVGRDRGPAQQVPGGFPPPSRPTDWSAPAPARVPPALPERAPAEAPSAGRQDSEALVMLRAMVNAAKADGRITPEEQQAILTRIGGSSPEAVRFLQREFDRPLDVREFAWSVPLGMEYKTYMISLSAIDLDTRQESDYLRELAHGLRLPKEVCDQLHQRCGVPPLP